MAGHVPADPEVIQAEIEEGHRKNLFGHVIQRSGMKLASVTNQAKIAVCIPIGPKDETAVMECPECNQLFTGQTIRSHGLVPIEFLLMQKQLVMPLLATVHWYYRKSLPSARAREQMTHDAIEHSDCDYIFYLDDDIMLPPHAIYDLHQQMEKNPEAAIITGVYVTRQDCPEPIAYRQQGEGAFWDFCTDRGVLEPIHAAGAGVMMVRTKALRDVERLVGRPWWDDEYNDAAVDPTKDGSRHMWGHDIRFFNRMWEVSGMYKPEADIGFMSMKEATELARRELDGKPHTEPEIGILAHEIAEKARAEREEKLIEAGSALAPWQCYLAGWVSCYHFDYLSQTQYALPADSPPIKNSNTRGYWNHQAAYERSVINAGVLQTRLSAKILHPLVAEKVPEGSGVVDLGCYKGDLGDLLIKRRGARYYGVDISDRAIEELRGGNMDGEVADLRDMKELPRIADRGPDIVTCLEVLEHLDDERFSNALHLLSGARTAIVSVPSGHMDAPGKEHIREFTQESLRDTLREHFPVVEVEEIEPHYLLAVCKKE